MSEWGYYKLTLDDAAWTVPDPRGGELYLDADEVKEYNKDPYLWVGRQVGLTPDELREFIRLDGIAFCSERTKSGRPCGIPIKSAMYNPEKWKKYHREIACHVHGGE